MRIAYMALLLAVLAGSPESRAQELRTKVAS